MSNDDFPSNPNALHSGRQTGQIPPPPPLWQRGERGDLPERDAMLESYVKGIASIPDPMKTANRQDRSQTVQASGRQSGFTLIEILVVVIIIGLLAALVGPRLFTRVGKSKQAATQAQIELFGVALDNFRLDVGRYPTTQEGLQVLQTNPGIEGWDGPYLKKEIPPDPWGRAYAYKAPGDHGEYDLISYGADGAPSGEGENVDIVSWQVLKKSGS